MTGMTPTRKMAVDAALFLVVLGLGLLGSFLLTSPGRASTAVTYTYPTTTKPPGTTTKPETAATHEDTTTDATTTPESTTTTAETTTTVSTTTSPAETTGAPATSFRSTRNVKMMRNRRFASGNDVDQRATTLYHLTTERNRTIACIGGCTAVWPPIHLPTGAKELPGTGLTKSQLGSRRRPDEPLQRTYARFPRYRLSRRPEAG